MKKSVFCLTLAAASLFPLTAISAESTPATTKPATPPPDMSEGDKAWLGLRAAMFVQTDGAESTPADPAATRAALARRAMAFTAAADRAKNFYTVYTGHRGASEARAMEVQALLGALQMGDASNEGRLNDAVKSLRADPDAPTKVKSQAVAMQAFNRAMRGKKNHVERLAAIEEVSRSLIVDFPTEPQGYESLLTVALTSGDDARARKIADELLKSPASAAVKEGAQRLAGSLDLVGKTFSTEIASADAPQAKSAIKAGQITVLYTWASWSPVSIKLAAKLKTRGGNATLLGLNLDQDAQAAEAVAAKESLPGTQIYDTRGRAGSLAQRLSIRTAPQVIIIDAAGKVREVRGELDLEKKLIALVLCKLNPAAS